MPEAVGTEVADHSCSEARPWDELWKIMEGRFHLEGTGMWDKTG